ncbi:hypothetical protein M1V28_29070 [Pseudomonas aeruginosa]|nr:hypothetical protein [Pseudomonas aeruginosa]WBM07268.1 hypothetical protein M1V28_29070 [Pseudomonas aeruginosa]
MIYDEAGTSPIVAVDAGAITEIRTAAASAHATRILAPPNACRVGFWALACKPGLIYWPCRP